MVDNRRKSGRGVWWWVAVGCGGVVSVFLCSCGAGDPVAGGVHGYGGVVQWRGVFASSVPFLFSDS